MGKILEFLFGEPVDYEKLYHEQLTENSKLKEEIHDMNQKSFQKMIETERRVHDALKGNLSRPVIERLENDYAKVCDDRASLKSKLMRYENTDLDRENKRLITEIKCMKFKIEELEREKEEFKKLLDRYDVFFKSLGKE